MNANLAGWTAPAPSTKLAPDSDHGTFEAMPNWGNMRLGNGLFDPGSGFAGKGLSPHVNPEAALMTSIAQFVLEDD